MQPEVNAENLSLILFYLELFTKAQTSISVCLQETLCSCIEVLQLSMPLLNLPERDSSLYPYEKVDRYKKQMLRNSDEYCTKILTHIADPLSDIWKHIQ